VRRQIVETAQQLRIVVKTLPGLYELITGEVGLAGQIRPVQVEDVLGREQVEVDFHEVAEYLEGQTVLVTGAGGSIGAELCRQIARVAPARLVLVVETAERHARLGSAAREEWAAIRAQLDESTPCAGWQVEDVAAYGRGVQPVAAPGALVIVAIGDSPRSEAPRG